MYILLKNVFVFLKIYWYKHTVFGFFFFFPYDIDRKNDITTKNVDQMIMK